ncbi:MAG: hypothetical protein ACI8ZM_001881 [Crocinitomix sp.]
MFLTRSIFVCSLLLTALNSFSQDTLQTTESWDRYNEYFVLHSDSTFEYNLQRDFQYKSYGVGTYHFQKKKLIFKFDSSLFKSSSYTCTSELEDSVQLKIISTLTQSDIANYYFYINGDKNINGWIGSDNISASIDSVIIGHQYYNPIVIYPKEDSCSCYWISLGFKNYSIGNEYLILEGEIVFKQTKFKNKNLYKRLYNSDTDLVYKKLENLHIKQIIGFYEGPFLLKKY